MHTGQQLSSGGTLSDTHARDQPTVGPVRRRDGASAVGGKVQAQGTSTQAPGQGSWVGLGPAGRWGWSGAKGVQEGDVGWTGAPNTGLEDASRDHVWDISVVPILAQQSQGVGVRNEKKTIVSFSRKENRGS